uniref:Uncharacterized protein n=1 Tax=Xenopus tropicalis TaxID=8364 RepID=A0A1B8Y416_XENTR
MGKLPFVIVEVDIRFEVDRCFISSPIFLPLLYEKIGGNLNKCPNFGSVAKIPQCLSMIFRRALALFRGLPKSQFMRIKRIASNDEVYEDESLKMVQKFVEKGYRQSDLMEVKREVGLIPRNETLKINNKVVDKVKRIPFITTYDINAKARRNIILKHWGCPIFGKIHSSQKGNFFLEIKDFYPREMKVEWTGSPGSAGEERVTLRSDLLYTGENDNRTYNVISTCVGAGEKVNMNDMYTLWAQVQHQSLQLPHEVTLQQGNYLEIISPIGAQLLCGII